MRRCTHPQRGPPVPGPQDVTWKPLSNPISPTSVGLPLFQKVSAWEAWLHRGSEADNRAGSLLVCVCVCVCVWVCGKPIGRSQHDYVTKDSAGWARFCTSGSLFIIVIIFGWPRKITGLIQSELLWRAKPEQHWIHRLQLCSFSTRETRQQFKFFRTVSYK